MAKKGLTKKQLKTLKDKLLKDELQTTETMEKLQENDPFKDPDHVNDNAAVDTDVREQLGHDTIEAEIKSLQRKIDYIHNALEKMKKGTYGVCESSGNPISFERLKLVPEARYCTKHHKHHHMLFS